VINRCKGDLCLDMVTEILEHGTAKILGTVDGDLLGNTLATDEVLPKKIGWWRRLCWLLVSL
jgi:hypothetical protein